MPTFFLMHIPQDAGTTEKIATELAQLSHFAVELNEDGDLTQIAEGIPPADVVGIVVSHQALCTPEIHDGFVKARAQKKRIILLLVETLDKRLLFNEWEDFDFEQTAQQNWNLFKHYAWLDFRNPREFFFDVKRLEKTLRANFASRYLNKRFGWKPTQSQPALKLAFAFSLILLVAALSIAVFAMYQVDDALRNKRHAEEDLVQARTAQAETYAPLATQVINQQNQSLIISEMQMTQQALMSESDYAYQQGETVRSVLWASFAQDALASGQLDVALPLTLAAYRLESTPVPEVIDTLNDIAQHPLPASYLDKNAYPDAQWTISPDASTLVAVTENEDGLHIVVHTTVDQAETEYTLGNFANILKITFSPNNQYILLLNETNEISVWDVSTGQETQRLTTEGTFTEAIFTPDSQKVVSGGLATDATGELLVWNIANGQIETRLAGTANQEIRQLAIAPENDWFAVAYADSGLAFGQLSDAELPTATANPDVYVSAVAIAANGKYGINTECTTEETVCRVIKWDTQFRDAPKLLARADFPVSALTIASDWNKIYVAGCNQTCRLVDIDVETGVFHAIRPVSYQLITQIAINLVDNTLFTVADKGAMNIWHLLSQPHSYKTPIAEAITLSPTGDQFVVAQSNGNLTVYNAQTGLEAFDFTGDQANDVVTMAYSADGTRLVTVERNGPLKLWDVVTHEFIREFDDYTGQINHVAMSRDRQLVIASTEARDIMLWDATTGELLYEVEAHGSPIEAVAISDDHNWGISATGTGEVFVWDLVTKRLMRNIYVNGISDIRFVPNEWSFVLVTQSGEVNLWYVQSQAVTMTHQLQSAKDWKIGFLESGKHVIFAAGDEVRIWNHAFNIDFPAAIQVPTHTRMTHIEVSTLNDMVWMIDEAGQAYRWQILVPEDLIQAFYDSTTIRELTCEERTLYYFEPNCNQGIYATRTPFRATASFTPTSTSSPTATATATFDPSSPTVTPSPSSTLFEIPTVTIAPTYTPSLTLMPSPTETIPVISAFALE